MSITNVMQIGQQHLPFRTALQIARDRNSTPSRTVKTASVRQAQKMARIKMFPISQIDADRKVKLIGADRLSLPGGDDYACGHCDYTILIAFDPRALPGDPALQCRNCEEFSLLPRSREGRRKQG